MWKKIIVAGLLGRVVAGTMGGATIMMVALGAGVITDILD